jgi:hypothetical protein
MYFNLRKKMNEGGSMKKLAVVSVVLVLGLVLAGGVFGADKDAIKKQVDEVVAGLNGGKTAGDFADYAKKDPYVFIMEASGNMLVHPSLVGKSLKETAEPVYTEVVKGTPEGLWVDYEWQGKKKHTYTRKTAAGLIVGSGYSE